MRHDTERLCISSLASSATERKGKSRRDSPSFYKMWESILVIIADITRHCLEDGTSDCGSEEGGHERDSTARSPIH